MGSDLVAIFVSAALATLNPSLLAAVTVMLLLPHPRRLMLGYLLGAYTTSLAAGLSLVFSLHGTGAVKTARHRLSPSADIAVGAVVVAVSIALGTDRDAPLRAWRARRTERKAGVDRSHDDRSWQMRMLGRGSARVTFLVGAALSFPGVTYLAALHHIVTLNPGAIPAIVLVVAFCVMQQLLIELPLLAYLLAPEWTPQAVARFRAWLTRRGRRIAVVALAVAGILLMVRGFISLSG